MLQPGGMQDAVTVPPPAWEVVKARASFVLLEQLPVPTPTVAGSDEHQVRGTPVMVFPAVSSTVASMVFPLPEVTLTELLLPVMARAIDWTAQVVKSRGWLVTLLTLANSEVMPGVWAVTCGCPVSTPLIGALREATVRVATSAMVACQAKGPTLGVMSRP